MAGGGVRKACHNFTLTEMEDLTLALSDSEYQTYLTCQDLRLSILSAKADAGEGAQ